MQQKGGCENHFRKLVMLAELAYELPRQMQLENHQGASAPKMPQQGSCHTARKSNLTYLGLRGLGFSWHTDGQVGLHSCSVSAPADLPGGGLQENEREMG